MVEKASRTPASGQGPPVSSGVTPIGWYRVLGRTEERVDSSRCSVIMQWPDRILRSHSSPDPEWLIIGIG
jgi:hypothetical protein